MKVNSRCSHYGGLCLEDPNSSIHGHLKNKSLVSTGAFPTVHHCSK